RRPAARGRGGQNAQDQDQVRRQEALQGHRGWQGALSAIPQAPWHDQADQQADSSAARHKCAVQDRRRHCQKILPSEWVRWAMARVKRGVTAHAKHKKVLKAAKGYYGRRKNTIRVAKQAVEKANQYAYRDRKRRKRTFRALWVQRLNAAVRPFGMTYSRFIHGLGKAGLVVD